MSGSPIGKTDTPWTPSEIARARELWDAGMPTAEMGAALGRTKNMVCGLARRQKFPVRRQPGGQKPNMVPKRGLDRSSDDIDRLFDDPVKIGRSARVGSGGSRDATTAEALRNPLPIPRGIYPPARTCQWTDCVRAPWLFCDAPSLSGYSWCPDHKGRVFKEAA